MIWFCQLSFFCLFSLFIYHHCSKVVIIWRIWTHWRSQFQFNISCNIRTVTTAARTGSMIWWTPSVGCFYPPEMITWWGTGEAAGDCNLEWSPDNPQHLFSSPPSGLYFMFNICSSSSAQLSALTTVSLLDV